MRLFFKIVRFCIQTLFWTIVFTTLTGAGLFLVLKHGLPSSLVADVIDRLPTGDLFIRTGKVSYSFDKGVRISELKVLRRKELSAPIFSADDVYIKYSIIPDFTPLRSRLRSITVIAPKFPVLPGSSGKGSVFSPVFPEIPDFNLHLREPDILGIQAASLSGSISLSGKKIQLENGSIKWHDRNEGGVDAECTVDFEKQLAEINLSGKMYPSRLIPLMEPPCIDSPSVISQIRRYSGFSRPVEADFDMKLNLLNSDFAMALKVDAGSCTYNNTPLRSAVGLIRAGQTNRVMELTVDGLEVKTLTGTMGGKLAYSEKEDVISFDCVSEMDAPDFFGVIGLLNGNELEIIHCSEPPLIKGGGSVSLKDETDDGSIFNKVSGSFSLRRGAILNFKVSDTVSDIVISNYVSTLSGLRATPEHGGSITGSMHFLFPEYKRENTIFETDLNLENVDLRDFCHAMSITNDRSGKISGNIKIKSSVLKKRALPQMEGSGHINFKDGTIAQIPLFASLTPAMAKNVPGISPLVNQSTGSLDFTITNGVLRSENIKFEGAMFSISGRGSYDMVNDKLDVLLHANIFRETSLFGKITHWITFPFTKLLLEFKVTGSLENPECSYVNILEKILAL